MALSWDVFALDRVERRSQMLSKNNLGKRQVIGPHKADF